jgi:DNA-binding NarL/FixJ family response regulator
MAVAVERRPTALITARDAAFRAGVRLALAGTVDCWEADGPAAALDVVENEAVDICLLESDQAGSGVRLTELIQQTHPEIQVVLLAHTVSEQEFLRAVRAGAAGYLSDTINPARLPEIVAGVLRGEPAVPRALVRRLLEEFRFLGRRRIEVKDRPVVNLTRRESEVLDLIREGLPTHKIGRRLGISDVTVRRHRSSLFSKADAKSAAELLRLIGDRRAPGGDVASVAH